MGLQLLLPAGDPTEVAALEFIEHIQSITAGMWQECDALPRPLNERDAALHGILYRMSTDRLYTRGIWSILKTLIWSDGRCRESMASEIRAYVITRRKDHELKQMLIDFVPVGRSN